MGKVGWQIKLIIKRIFGKLVHSNILPSISLRTSENVGMTEDDGMLQAVRRNRECKFLVTNYQLLVTRAKKWFRRNGRKLATASVAVVLAIMMVVGLQPAVPTRATTYTIT